MEIAKYILYCGHSPEFYGGQFVEILSNKVQITLNLKMDEYIFKAICPDCGKKIINTRIAYDITNISIPE